MKEVLKEVLKEASAKEGGPGWGYCLETLVPPRKGVVVEEGVPEAPPAAQEAPGEAQMVAVQKKEGQEFLEGPGGDQLLEGVLGLQGDLREGEVPGEGENPEVPQACSRRPPATKLMSGKYIEVQSIIKAR